MQNNKQCNRLKPKPMAIDVGGQVPHKFCLPKVQHLVLKVPIFGRKLGKIEIENTHISPFGNLELSAFFYRRCCWPKHHCTWPLCKPDLLFSGWVTVRECAKLQRFKAALGTSIVLNERNRAWST